MKWKILELSIGKKSVEELRTNTAGNIGFGVIGAGRCNLHLQQRGGSCSGWTFFNLAFCC